MNGQYVAWTTFLLGLFCGGYSWTHLSRWPAKNLLEKTVNVALSGLVALSAFSNLSYLAWIVGLPLELGVVKDGRMAEQWWLGPTTLLWTVVCWYGNRPRQQR